MVAVCHQVSRCPPVPQSGTRQLFPCCSAASQITGQLARRSTYAPPTPHGRAQQEFQTSSLLTSTRAKRECSALASLLGAVSSPHEYCIIGGRTPPDVHLAAAALGFSQKIAYQILVDANWSRPSVDRAAIAAFIRLEIPKAVMLDHAEVPGHGPQDGRKPTLVRSASPVGMPVAPPASTHIS